MTSEESSVQKNDSNFWKCTARHYKIPEW